MHSDGGAVRSSCLQNLRIAKLSCSILFSSFAAQCFQPTKSSDVIFAIARIPRQHFKALGSIKLLTSSRDVGPFVPASNSPLIRTMRAAILAVITATVMCKNIEPGGLLANPFNASRIGVIDLPSIDPSAVPDFCRNFDDMCRDERSLKYESAFTAYESRYERCGDYGWNLTGQNRGYDAAVGFKTTPCGLHTAIKGSRRPSTILNIEKDCHRLKLLNSPAIAAECPACFPRAFFYSELTKACYSEYINSEKIGPLVRSVPKIKALLLQGVHIIRVLRRHNLQHGDITFRNMFIRKVVEPDNTVKLKLMLFDFAASRYLDDPGDGHNTGNRGFNDMYTLACNFYRNVYKDGGCRGHVIGMDKTLSKRTLKFALAKIMADNAELDAEPDFDGIAAIIHAAEGF